MGGKPSAPVKQWADSPFKLIETPRYKLGNRDLSNEKEFFIHANQMALVHNTLIRALNCVYLQAPNVKNPTDITDFLTYMQGWSRFLRLHHESEETVAFPVLEEMIGVPGFLEKNVEQHHAFGPGIDAFDACVKACQDGTETFDGIKIRKIIDGFGEILTQHLTDEIGTLLALEEYDDKIDWTTYHKKLNKKALDEGDTELELPCVITNMNFPEEDGIHGARWPPIPWHVLLIFRWWFIPKHKGAWRFSSCDSNGNPKELPFV